jgi:hypothetical protein
MVSLRGSPVVAMKFHSRILPKCGLVRVLGVVFDGIEEDSESTAGDPDFVDE